MKETKPQVYLVARPSVDYLTLANFIKSQGGDDYAHRLLRDMSIPGTVGISTPGTVVRDAAAALIEAAGRLCYRSWEPGLNRNVTKVRTDRENYLANILAQRHGSVLEHAQYTFIFENVSRVLTHELVRHRVGVGISQESLRYVRLTENLPFWVPDWAGEDEELQQRVREFIGVSEDMQQWLTSHFDIDSKPFHEKKRLTSFMRRFAPEGLTTSIMWSANIRTLRHVIETRTALGAEEEVRFVFGEVARKMVNEVPELFGDFEETAHGEWVPKWSKV